MIDQVVETYIKLRDRKAQIKAEYDAKVAPIEEALEKAEAFIMAQMQEQGVKSYRTEAGTAYTSERTSATVADWDAALGWVRDNERWDLLERRVNKKTVDEYVAANDELPPGVNYRRELTVNIRRA